MSVLDRLAEMRVDSPEGIKYLMTWAKAHRAVLSEFHESIARKHGVSTEGVMFSRPIAIQGSIYSS